jgi:hypothetical protein
MVGDNHDLIGNTALGIDGHLFDVLLVWTYKLVATKVASGTVGGLAFTWTSELSISRNNSSLRNSGKISRISMGKTDLGVVTQVGNGVRFSMYIDNRDFNFDTMNIVKYNHTFHRLA